MADNKQSREVKPITHTLDGQFVGCGNEACLCTDVCFGKATKINPFEYTGGDNEVRIAKGGSKPSDISIKITADVGEALTGFKALQRELRETTKAAREMEASYDALNERIAERTMYIGSGYLSEVTTKELSRELAKREGVTCHYVAPHGAHAELWLRDANSGVKHHIDGPATIIVNKD